MVFAPKRRRRMRLLLLLCCGLPWLLIAAQEEGGSCSSLEGSSNTKDESCGCALEPRDNMIGVEKSSRLVLKEELVQACKDVKPSVLLNIQGGLFTMGTTDVVNVADGEGPPRKVEVTSFRIEQTEVSVCQFARFVIETSYETDAERFGWSFAFHKTLSPKILNEITMAVASVPWWVPVNNTNWLYPHGPDQSAFPNKLNHPATHISHNDAKAYCAWLGGLRLPTEAEFEFAMRGGYENRSYPWGDELTPKGVHRANLWQGNFPDVNTVEDGFEWSSPVDAFGPQNDYGVYNIVGNVWEWVADAWIANHARLDLSKPLIDPLIEIQGKIDQPDTERVKRGGSYMCHKSYCLRYRTASRSSNTADSSAQNLGFRCAG